MTARIPTVALFAGALLAGALCPACGGSHAEDEVTANAPMPVATEPATRGTVEAVTSASGVMAAAPGAELIVTAPLAGRIARLPKGEGDAVRKGELLVEFDIPSSQADVAAREAELTQSHARLTNARNALTRLQGLFDRGVAARKEVEDAQREAADAQAAVSNAEAARGAAQRVASRTTVEAPFSGVVAKRWHNPGDLVEATATDPVLRVVDPARIEVVAAVPAAVASRVHPGQAARVRDALDTGSGGGAEGGASAAATDDAAADAAAGAGKGDTPGQSDKAGKAGKSREADSAGKTDKPEKTDKADKTGTADKTGKADKAEKTEKTDKADNDQPGFWPASVLTRPTVVDPATATANVRLALRKATGLPPIGTAVHVDIVTEVRKGVVTVPPAALVRDGGKTFVFVAGSDKKAHRREVKVGLSSESAVEIVSGITAGDNVIVRGHEALPDGAAIRPEESATGDDKDEDKKDQDASKKDASKDGKPSK